MKFPKLIKQQKRLNKQQNYICDKCGLITPTLYLKDKEWVCWDCFKRPCYKSLELSTGGA